MALGDERPEAVVAAPAVPAVGDKRPQEAVELVDDERPEAAVAVPAVPAVDDEMPEAVSGQVLRVPRPDASSLCFPLSTLRLPIVLACAGCFVENHRCPSPDVDNVDLDDDMDVQA